MSTNEQQTEQDPITAALDALALACAEATTLAINMVRNHEGAPDYVSLVKVGSFLLAYRRDRDEREAKRANVRGAGVGE